MPGPANIVFGGQITHGGSGFEESTADSNLAVNPLLDTQEVRGGLKIAGSLDSYLSAANGLFTLRSMTSLGYDTGAEEFRVYTGAAWAPLRDYLGDLVANVAIQLPGTEASPVTDDTNQFSVPVVRVGADDTGGLSVALSNERTDITPDVNDTFRLKLKGEGDSGGLGSTYDMANGDAMNIPMWDSDGQFRPSPLQVTSNGTLDTGTFTGDFTVTGNLTQGSNTTSSSLDVTNQYIKSNDGNTQDPAGGAYNTAAAQGGFLVQYGQTSGSSFLQVGIFWDAADSHWRKSHFTSPTSDANAVYSEVAHAASTPNVPVLETADFTDAYFTATGNDPFDHYYLTPKTAFTYHEFGNAGSDYDIDTGASVITSNQSMVQDGTTQTSVGGSTLLATTSNSGFETFNKVRAARIMNIRAFCTDTNATAKRLTIDIPSGATGFDPLNVMSISVYKHETSSTVGTPVRQELFGAEILPSGSTGDVVIELKQADLTAGEIFDIVIVF